MSGTYPGPSSTGTEIHRVERAKLHGADPGADFAGLDIDDRAWLEVPVPGDVRASLVAAGQIGDPYRDPTDSSSLWVDDQEWWYRFALPPIGDIRAGEALILRLEGIDTFATVFIDGVARHENNNMFRTTEIDVTEELSRHDAHVAAIQIKRPIDQIGGRADLADRRGSRVRIRKAQFGYGWDFAPYLPSIGVWRPVSLHRRRRAYIDSVSFQTLRISRDSAVVAVDAFVNPAGTEPPGMLEARIVLRAPDGREVLHVTSPVRSGMAQAVASIHQPELWWPHGRGRPSLYSLQVQVHSDGEEVDRHDSRVGIRTVRLDESPNPDELGRRFFRFIVNGRPCLLKGANWVPPETAVGVVTPERYESLLVAAREGNMNMLRVWGGGVYEHDAFYELCDQMGLLVWQEFMFACASYPDDDRQWLENIRAEAQDQVRRLRSHACLALWCGNNEVEAINSYLGRETGRSSGANIFYGVLPAVVAEEDGVTGYIPTSPMLGNGTEQGDRHNWDVWHGVAAILAESEGGDFVEKRERRVAESMKTGGNADRAEAMSR
ncbi:MAG: glycoside hydrolase family 2 protein, partial [Acidimicrobiales bacterium]